MAKAKSLEEMEEEFPIGKKFGQWIVVGEPIKREKWFVKCNCDCGRTDGLDIDCPSLLSGMRFRCNKCGRESSSITKYKTTEEYKLELSQLSPPIKLKDGEEYKSAITKIAHICPICKEDWLVTPHTILRGSRKCVNCSQKKAESLHATTLKQVLKHNDDNVIWEDESCVYNGKILKTDIVNHKDKWVIEVNGEQHYQVTGLTLRKSKTQKVTPEEYFKSQQERDNYKKYFWISKGYNFIEIDIRNKTPLDILQEYVDINIKEIPEYVDLTGKITTRNWSLEKAQKLLDNGYSYKEVAKEVGTTYVAIVSAVDENKLTKPSNYVINYHKPTHKWDVTKAQEYLDDRYSIEEISEIMKVSKSAITSAVYRGDLIKPKNYINLEDKNRKVLQIDININKIIKEYNYCIDVGNGFGNNSVSKACKGNYKDKGHEYKGYLWYYKKDYEKMIKEKDNTVA